MIEGSRLSVCDGCAKLGRVVGRPQPIVRKTQTPAKLVVSEPVETIVTEFAKIIRTAREKKGMTQAEFAQKLNEKESVIQKLENGSITPPVSLARKLEKMLHITLVEFEKGEETQIEHAKTGTLTIGDLIKIKK